MPERRAGGRPAVGGLGPLDVLDRRAGRNQPVVAGRVLAAGLELHLDAVLQLQPVVVVARPFLDREQAVVGVELRIAAPLRAFPVVPAAQERVQRRVVADPVGGVSSTRTTALERVDAVTRTSG